MKKERFVLAFFTGCLISAVSLQAQTSKDSTKVARSYAINEVVVTGTRSETDVRHLPMTVSVVGRPQLEASQQTSVLPVLNSQVPGFFSTSRGVMGYGVATGASGQMSLRGIGGPAQAGLPTTGLLVLIDGMVLLWDQSRIQFQRRGRLLEQYLPMVEELVESVRAQQHEYNNRMMAISAAVMTTGTLDEAKAKITELTGQISLNPSDRELLKCDSKVLCGMLFGKIMQAQMQHIQLQISIAGSFLHRSLSESDWIDLLGILLDNALEASSDGDTVYLQAEDEVNALLLLVSNPCPPISRTEMTEMFRRGWSTKADQGRGYGLSNVRKMVEQHGGKIIVKNEEKNGQNYLTIGALIS